MFGADWTVVTGNNQRVYVPFLIGLVAIVLSACGVANFDRADAITSLQASGATLAEATCIADRLVEVGELDAADPRITGGADGRESLLLANQQCVTVEVLPEVELAVETTVAANPTANRPGNDPQAADTADQNALESLVARRQSAIAQLRSFGRSMENATCIVDQLIAAEADGVFEDDQFGLGLDTAEAAAFATCI